MSRRWWALAALTAGLWLAMVALAPPGLPDARIAGYDVAGLTDWARDGRAVAQARRVLALDMLFPALLVVVLVGPLPRGVWWLPALAYGVADYLENLMLWHVYRGGQPVAITGAVTQAKWALVAVAFMALALHTLVRRR